MPQIGWFEILIIVTIAILVIGPKDFPFMLKKVGSWIGSVKKYVSNVQKEISVIENENFDESIDNNNQSSKKDKNDEKKE